MIPGPSNFPFSFSVVNREVKNMIVLLLPCIQERHFNKNIVYIKDIVALCPPICSLSLRGDLSHKFHPANLFFSFDMVNSARTRNRLHLVLFLAI